MILLLGGTGDSRELARYLSEQGVKIVLTVLSEYGNQLAQELGNIKVITGALNAEKMHSIVFQHGISTIVDSTHPYATEISSTAMEVAVALGVGYCRFERSEEDYSAPAEQTGLIHYVSGLAEAATKAAELGNQIFLTTGSKNLAEFLAHPAIKNKRIIVRVLPDRGIIEKCLDLGARVQDIIAMQGPFTSELNKAMYLQTAAEVVVTKASGATGGADTKIKAAQEIGLPVVIIKRPSINYQNKCTTFLEIWNYIKRSGR